MTEQGKSVLPIERKGNSPLVKWAGGKRFIVSHIQELLPTRFERYFEPFVGGGALFFALGPKRATLGDKNHELIEAYTQLRDDAEGVIRALSRLRNTETEYYRIRSCAPSSAAGRSARLIYLCTLSFNGIHRVNLKGEFNVPYGKKTHIEPCDRNHMVAISKALQGISLLCGDFDETLGACRADDLVYLDPPYTVAHGNNGFIKYNAKIFSWSDQVRLAQTAQKLADRGCAVLVSNADHDSIHQLYRNFQVRTIQRASVMAADAGFRRSITECIFYSKV